MQPPSFNWWKVKVLLLFTFFSLMETQLLWLRLFRCIYRVNILQCGFKDSLLSWKIPWTPAVTPLSVDVTNSEYSVRSTWSDFACESYLNLTEERPAAGPVDPSSRRLNASRLFETDSCLFLVDWWCLNLHRTEESGSSYATAPDVALQIDVDELSVAAAVHLFRLGPGTMRLCFTTVAEIVREKPSRFSVKPFLKGTLNNKITN